MQAGKRVAHSFSNNGMRALYTHGLLSSLRDKACPLVRRWNHFLLLSLCCSVLAWVAGTKTQGGGLNHFWLHPQPWELLGAIPALTDTRCPSVRIVRKNTLWFLTTQMWGGLSAVGTEAWPHHRHLTFRVHCLPEQALPLSSALYKPHLRNADENEKL